MDELIVKLFKEYDFESGKKIWNDFYEYYHMTRKLDVPTLTDEEIIAAGVVLCNQIYFNK